MTIFGLPLILFEVGVEDVGDAEFLRDKEVAGNLITVHGTDSATGDAVTTVPATGKTFFIFAASVNITSIDVVTTHETRAELQNDGAIMDSASIFSSATSDLPTLPKVDFIIVSDSLVGNGSKAYSIDVITNPQSDVVRGTIEGWIEDT